MVSAKMAERFRQGSDTKSALNSLWLTIGQIEENFLIVQRRSSDACGFLAHEKRKTQDRNGEWCPGEA